MMSSKQTKIEKDTSVFFMQMRTHLVMTLRVKTVCDVTASRDTRQPITAPPSLYSVQYGFNVAIFECRFRLILMFLYCDFVLWLDSSRFSISCSCIEYWKIELFLLIILLWKWRVKEREREKEGKVNMCAGFAQPNQNFCTVFLTPLSLTSN